MKKNFLIVACGCLCALIVPSSAFAAFDPTDAVVKIFTTSNSIDYYMPWQSTGTSLATGSGSVIEGNKILTNAHVISDQTFIQIKKNSDPKKYTARLLAIGYDCDLALLTVDDPEFFKGITPLQIGDLPKLQDSVIVLGYPQGGDKISVTEGVVSRIEVTPYSQSSRSFLTVQIDAAINPGNSGGPAVQNEKVAGVVMQMLVMGQNIGYIIPPPVIRHFFKDLEDGNYDGFPMVGIDYSAAENDAMRKYFKAEDLKGGVLVTNTAPFSPSENYLHEGDVILAIDGVPIGEDGTFAFRGTERLTLSYLISQKQVGDSVKVKIVRDGKNMDVNIKLDPFEPLVPYSHYFEKPPYYIYGGLVFTVLSMDLLETWGMNRWWEKAPVDFAYYGLGSGRLNKSRKKELVVLLNVVADDINAGYNEFSNEIIAKVNGQEIMSFKQFVLLLNEIKSKEPFTIFETEQKIRMVLDNHNIDSITSDILNRNNIPRQYSLDVEGWLK